MECCGTCKHCEWDMFAKEWVCVNMDSDNYSLETLYANHCEEWEGRQ